MKTVKKILSLVVAFSVMMSVVAFASYNDVDYDADYADALELLSVLEIIEGDELGNFNPEDTITRAEMAAIVCRAKGLENAASGSKGTTAYYDVPANHWASGYINMATQTGIINGHGDGRFAPEDDVTYDEAVKMIVCALGFEPMATARGGYPTGHLIVANTYNITEGVTATYEAPRKAVAQLIYNALSTPMMDQTSWGLDAEYEVFDGKRGRDYKTLLTEMDIYIATGIVGTKSYDEVEFEITEYSDDLEFTKGYTESFIINNSDITNYQHQNVDVYVRKNSRRNYEVVAVVSAVQGTTLTIISDDVEDYLNNKVSYYIDAANSSKTKTIKLESAPTVEYNKRTYSGTVASLLAEDDVELKFIENTGDTTYDVIVATKYVSARVDYVDANKDRIEIGSETVYLDFDDEDITIILEDDKGNVLDLSDFEEDDVVAVVADNDRIKNYIEYIRIIKLSNAVVRGSVDSTFSVGGDNYVTIDDEDFIDASDHGLEVGDEGLFFIGMTGKIIDFDGSSVGKNYAYVLEAGVAKQTFSDDKWQIKLLTRDNGVITYSLTDDADEYFKTVYAPLIGINTATDSKQLFENLSASEKADPDRLITYKTNSSGYIRSFASANVSGTTVKTLSSSKDEYNDRTQKINGAILEDNAVVYNLTNSSADNAYTTGISYLTDEGKYSGFVFANEDYEYCVMVITGGEGAFASDSGIAIVTKAAKATDNNDRDIVRVTFVQNEETGVVYFGDESENRAGADDAYEALKVGDIFAYNADADGEVSEYVILGTVSGGLLKVNKYAYSSFDEDTEFVYGYISTTSAQRKNNSKGELITVNDGNEEVSVRVASYTNEYTYNDAGRNIVIETEDFMAEDAYYFDDEKNEATFAFLKISDGALVDIYSFNKRVIIGDSVNAELLIDSIGTVTFTPESLAKIEKAEAAYEALTEEQKKAIDNYSDLVAARKEYEALADADAAAKVDALIDAIGVIDETTDLDKYKANLEAAEAALKALTEAQKLLVTKGDVLASARSAYDAKVTQIAVENAISKIEAIGEVNKDSKPAIDAAEEAYNAVPEEARNQVTNKDKLEAAIAAYKLIVDTAAADAVEAKISAIGEVTLDSAEAISGARAAYDALEGNQKALVENYSVLTAAEAALEQLVSQSQINQVELAIMSIGEIEPNNDTKSRIEAAQKAMNSLTPAQQALVENASELEKAQESYEETVSEVNTAITLIDAIGTVQLTNTCDAKIKAASAVYDDLTATEKKYVTNVQKLDEAVKAYNTLFDKAEAEKVTALIKAIGKVELTTACEGKITAAEKAFEALTKTQALLVTNAADLKAARTSYDALSDAKAASDVTKVINAIGKVDTSAACKAKIEAAEKAYDGLTAAQQKLVTNYTVLTAARDAYNALTTPATSAAPDTAETTMSTTNTTTAVTDK